MKESAVEKQLERKVRMLGGRAMKFISPSYRGRPDRLVLLHGLYVFVEVKTDVGKLSPLQEYEIQKLRDHKAVVCVVYGASGVDAFIEDLKIQSEWKHRDPEWLKLKGEYK